MRIGKRSWGVAMICLAALAWLAWSRLSEAVNPAFYYEFGVEVSYKGRPLTISRVVECVQPGVDRRTFPATGRSQEAMAEQLEDGSGLIVIIPSLCDAEAWP